MTKIAFSTYYCAVAVLLLLGSCSEVRQDVRNNIEFKARLSEYKLFTTNMSDLAPAEGVHVLELASTLFTDYAEKQRLLKVPEGQKLIIQGDGLPTFPEGSIIAKTFFYSRSNKGTRQIIETRLLILNDKQWNAATYRWDNDQQEAFLLHDGAVVPIAFTQDSGAEVKIEYKIPSQNDCGACHHSGDKLTPIGPKARNLNIEVQRQGVSQNQLTYLMKVGIIKPANTSSISSLPKYHDSTQLLSLRARAYLEMNCAHCHQPGGMGGSTSLNLQYEETFEDTGIEFNKSNILIRMSTMGEYHMPKLGTTVTDVEGVDLIKRYIEGLDNNADKKSSRVD